MKQKKIIGKGFGHFVVLFFLFVIIGACSTEKNTFVNRVYHSTTARYNGLFNAREMIRISLEEYQDIAREDFNDILPIELLPTEDNVADFYPVIDTAITKCEKVIQQHSMPTASKPSQKKTEHANWIDQNWLMIGRAQYLRQDYQASLKTNEYVRKFFEDQPSSYLGALGEIKALIKLGDLTEARLSLQKLDQKISRINNSDEKAEKSKKRRKTKNVKKSPEKENKTPSLPKNFKFEISQTKAILAMAENNHKEAIKHLEDALKNAKKKYDKARINFILGQLYQEAGDTKARDFYSEAIKKNAPFEMSFNAKINRALISDLGANEMIAELEKLAKEARYLEFRDQIYYAMSKIELERNDRDMAKHDLSRSVFYSLNNNLQKGVSYETLGDLTFEEKDYVSAQRYYDSSAQVIPETYKNYEIIKNKANNLAQLVNDIEVITFEDSVQRIAMMDEKQREDFLKDVIKQLKKEEQERKEREAVRAEQLRKLQQTYDAQNQKGGNKFYFSNQKAIQEGFEEFRSRWGLRENEDYWRLSNKPARISMDIALSEDSLATDQQTLASTKAHLDSLTVDDLLVDIPLTDSAFAQSNENLIAALYNSGRIYQEQLNENDMASAQYQRIIDKNEENIHNVMAAFQLYKINETSGNPTPYKQYILTNYPDSDYANYLRDPDYFVKKKERDALALKDYLRSVTHFEQGLFYPVITKANQVIDGEPDNNFRKEYILLKAMAMGRVNQDKSSLVPVLQQAIDEYPETEVAVRSQELIDLINNGVPPFEEFEIAEPDIFNPDSKQYYAVLILENGEDGKKAAISVTNFNGVYFNRLNLSVSDRLYSDSVTFILIDQFKTSGEASSYIRDFKNAKRYVHEINKNEILIISKENLRTIMLDKKLIDYKKFHDKYF
ncbi:MAG: hypothetical protein WC994_08495 [Brumimicrobium sp.]